MVSASEPTPDSKPRSSTRLAVNIAIGLTFSAFFVWIVVRGVDWDEFSLAFDTMEPIYLVAYFGLLSAAHMLRLVRWGLTIRPLAPVPWRRILAVGAVGMMAIFSLPARLGELVRPLMISEDPGLDFGKATATVVIERILDGLTMSAILFGTALLLDPELVPEEFIISGYVASTIFGGASLALLISALTFKWIKAPLKNLIGRWSEPLADKILGTIGGFFDALRLLGKARVMLSYMALTTIIWAISGLAIAVLFEAFPGSTGDLPVIGGFAVLSVIVVGIMIPAGPGTVGVFHWAVVLALGMFAVGSGPALLFATVLHLLIAAVNLFWGMIGWIGGGIEVSLLWRKGSPEAPQTPQS